jgi:type VI secretion system secreted protein Hcp
MRTDNAFEAARQAGSSVDAYLAVTSRRQGAVRGEAQVPGHADEINVIGWRWGMTAPSSALSASTTGRRVHQALLVEKHIDRSSVPLMTALCNNDVLRTVKLALRKAGTGQDDYFEMELSDVRVIGLDMEAAQDGSLFETVKFTYQRISLTYYAQQANGQRGAAVVFEDTVGAQA